MAEQKIKAILFDLDMTLADLMTAKTSAIDSAINAMIDAGLKMEKDIAYEELKKEYFEDFEGRSVMSNFLKNQDEKNPRILAAGINAYRKTKEELLKPYPEVIETLKKLKSKGLKLAVVTDAPSLKAHRRLDAIGVIDFFDVIISTDDTNGKKKPSPEPFMEALKRLNISAEEALHVGDWPERDIKGAKNVGLGSIHAKYGNILSDGSYKEKADFEIESFEQILGIIYSINQKA